MSFIVDCLATCCILGIWPRFIEPRLLKTTFLSWQLSPTASHLDGLKIVHITDLHFHQKISHRFTEKIIRKINALDPDLIFFTGDFICYSHLENPKELLAFLCRLKAQYGAYCAFGNHDYQSYVSLNQEGQYDLARPSNPLMGAFRGIKTLLSSQKMAQGFASSVLSIPMHSELCSLIGRSPFQLLENRTVTLPIGLNVTGLGDFALGRCDPRTAFSHYDPQFPGIVLSHNPDTFPLLLSHPGDWILAGHTHGEQIHFPWPKWGRRLSQKLTRLSNQPFTRGLFYLGNKKCYVNRGLGCHKPFRLFSPPEICLITASIKN